MKLYLRFLCVSVLCYCNFAFSADSSTPLKVLHLTFHKGCAKEIETVAKEIGIDVMTWYIQDLPDTSFDGVAKGNAIYNIGHDRAQRVWDLHKDFFDLFDVILTSDTAPLCRIFLQNGWTKPLVIWICNRFDYRDVSSLDCAFPDKEYYDLFARACTQDNVTIVAYTAYEHDYARSRGINTGSLLIKPTGLFLGEKRDSLIPADITKEETFFCPPYSNELTFIDAQKKYTSMGIPSYCGRYAGSQDLEQFKAIIHLPYAWSNLALFENVYLGTPYLIPSVKFFKQLAQRQEYWYPRNEKMFTLSEWYDPENAPFFVYFDSWEDLVVKTNTIDFASKREALKEIGHKHAEEMLNRWRSVFRL